MSHTLTFSSGSVIPIYVYDQGSSLGPIMAEHQILDSTHTTYQYLGTKSTQTLLAFTINSRTHLAYIGVSVRDGWQFVYTDDKGYSGSYICTGEFTYKRYQALNYTEPWYECRMPLSVLVSSGSLYYQT